MVIAGRREEVEYMHEKLEMFEFVPAEEAMMRSGEAPVSTKWVDVWKMGEDGKWFVRSRLVARDFKPRNEKDREDLLAAMPPLEAKKLLFRMAAAGASRRRRRGEPEVKLMFIDVRKAHLDARCDEDVFVEPPEEFAKFGR